MASRTILLLSGVLILAVGQTTQTRFGGYLIYILNGFTPSRTLFEKRPFYFDPMKGKLYSLQFQKSYGALGELLVNAYGIGIPKLELDEFSVTPALATYFSHYPIQDTEITKKWYTRKNLLSRTSISTMNTYISIFRCIRSNGLMVCLRTRGWYRKMEFPKLKKFLFELKRTLNNGLTLKIQPTTSTHNGENRQFRFIHCTFSENNFLAMSSTDESICVVDLENQKYWRIPHKGEIARISFQFLMNHNLLVALNSGAIEIIAVETGSITGILTGHSTPVKEISYSFDGRYCLASNYIEAIIWDLMAYSQAYKLTLKDNMSLKKAFFMPVGNNIFAQFQDDVMLVWKFGTFECVKQIMPEAWSSHIKIVAVTRNGRVMAFGGCTPKVVIFCSETWSVMKVIELPDSLRGVKHMEFVPQPFDSGSDKILAVLTNTFDIYFANIETSLFLNYVPCIGKLVGYFSVSPDGKYLAANLVSGEMNVYTTKSIFPTEEAARLRMPRFHSPSQNSANAAVTCVHGNTYKNGKFKWKKQLNRIHSELKQELKFEKLIPILKQYLEYPDSYRRIIWKSILKLPLNQVAFNSFANRECHPAYLTLDLKYPLVNKVVCNTLKRVLSSLAYWSPLFSEVVFLPEFVFPFVKFLHFDPLVCFESVATIIVNWYQNWFEFYPFPPINTLSIIENILAYHDQDLLEFYIKKNITSCVYACLLMQTAFSEVLTKNEWLRLWDHVLSTEPSFLYMAVIAYNVICRNAIRNCETCRDVEILFHEQNVIDIKLLILKSYYFLENTPSGIHPRQYLKSFSPLKKGETYILHLAYPKLIFDRSSTKLNLIRKEEREILEEQKKAIAMKSELDGTLKNSEKLDIQEDILTELDEQFRKIINFEEERLTAQRKRLHNLRNELRLKELFILQEIRDQIFRKQCRKKELEIKRLLRDIESKRVREKSELDAVEDEIRNYYSSLLLRKHQLKFDLEAQNELDAKADILEEQDEVFRSELNDLHKAVAYEHGNGEIDIANRISEINDILENKKTFYIERHS